MSTRSATIFLIQSSTLDSLCKRAKKAAREAISAGIETASLFSRRTRAGFSHAESSLAWAITWLSISASPFCVDFFSYWPSGDYPNQISRFELKSYSKSVGVKLVQFITHSASAPPEMLPSFMHSSENSVARRSRAFAEALETVVRTARASASSSPLI